MKRNVHTNIKPIKKPVTIDAFSPKENLQLRTADLMAKLHAAKPH